MSKKDLYFAPTLLLSVALAVWIIGSMFIHLALKDDNRVLEEHNTDLQNELLKKEKELEDLDYYKKVLQAEKDKNESLQSNIQILEETIRHLNLKPKDKVDLADRSNKLVNYNWRDVSKPSNVSAKTLDKHFEGTPLANHGQYFVVAEEKFGINALFLSALAVNESAWGRSKIATTKNNLFGFKSFNRSPYSSSEDFASYGECITYVGGYISQNYLNPKGKFYNGKSVDNINKRYAVLDNGSPNREWGKNIKILMKKLSK